MYLMKRLFQFSDLVWRICLEDRELKMVLEKDVDSVIPMQTGIQIHRFLLPASTGTSLPLQKQRQE